MFTNFSVIHIRFNLNNLIRGSFTLRIYSHFLDIIMQFVGSYLHVCILNPK